MEEHIIIFNKHARKHGYILVRVPGHPRANVEGRVYEHILVAEKILGHVLSPPGEVHHIDNDGSANRNDNLVICQDRAYHKLIHNRTLAFEATGDPHKRKCGACGKWLSPESFGKHAGRERNGRCKQCGAAMARKWEHENLDRHNANQRAYYRRRVQRAA